MTHNLNVPGPMGLWIYDEECSNGGALYYTLRMDNDDRYFAVVTPEELWDAEDGHEFLMSKARFIKATINQDLLDEFMEKCKVFRFVNPTHLEQPLAVIKWLSPNKLTAEAMREWVYAEHKRARRAWMDEHAKASQAINAEAQYGLSEDEIFRRYWSGQ